MCTSPFVAQKHLQVDGKYKVVFCGKRFVAGRDQLDTIAPFVDSLTGLEEKPFVVPCGHCFECRTAYSNMWSSRMMMEYLSSDKDKCWFLTLSYDDSCIPSVPEGSSVPIHNLEPDDVTKFLKRLRFAVSGSADSDIRYFYSGEYGGQTARPHYHMIIYNLELSDLEVQSQNKNGDLLFRSRWLESIWKKGFIWIGLLSKESCAYVARYNLKKQKDDNLIYSTCNLQKPFCRMSRMPGLGKAYILNHLSDSDTKLYLPKGNVVLLPKYARNVIRSNLTDSSLCYDDMWSEVFKKFSLSEEDRKCSIGVSEKDYLRQKEKINADKLKMIQQRSF